ncbi:MAG TPA: protein kinase [Ktedonobacterales bacterium]
MTAQISDLGHGLKLVERYQVAERLSDGLLCAVYRGQDLTLRRPIAIKVVPPSHVESYRTALRLSASFSHPAVVCVYDMIEQNDSLYLIQEYVAARALSDYLPAGLPIERAVDIASQIAFALSYAHVKGVIHGDLTPAAVLIDRHALVRLNNFYAPADETYFTRVRDAVARDIGLEPEQIAVQPDETGDVIALGYLLWLMTTEATAQTAQSDQPADMFLRSARADIPETLTALLRRIFDLSSAPSAITAAEVAIELERLSNDYAAARSGSILDVPAAIKAYRAFAESAEWSNEPTIASGRSAIEQVARAAPGPRRGGTQVFPAEAGDTHKPSDDAPFGIAPRLRLPSRPIGDGASLRATPDLSAVAMEDAQPDLLHETESGGLPLTPLLLLGAVLFVLFFLVGFYSFTFGR